MYTTEVDDTRWACHATKLDPACQLYRKIHTHIDVDLPVALLHGPFVQHKVLQLTSSGLASPGPLHTSS